MKSQRTKNTLLKNAQAIAKAIFLREYFFSSPSRIFNFISLTLRCFNFFAHAQPTTDKHTDSSSLDTYKHSNIDTDKEARTANSTYPKGGVSCSKDSFVGNQTLVFQIKFCGKSPALRVAANR